MSLMSIVTNLVKHTPHSIGLIKQCHFLRGLSGDYPRHRNSRSYPAPALTAELGIH